jgi:hypothetical protein
MYDTLKKLDYYLTSYFLVEVLLLSGEVLDYCMAEGLEQYLGGYLMEGLND